MWQRVVAEYSESFSERDNCALSKNTVTNSFNHPSEDYVNFISTDLSAQMISTQNDGQNLR